VSVPTGPDDRTGVAGAEAVLVRTGTTDPVAALGAASRAPDDGPLLVAVATVPRERLERRLTETGWDLGEVRRVDFLPSVGPTDGTSGDEPGRSRDDLAGLSMELVRRFDGLSEDGGAVYLDSLEPLVSVAGAESAFRFLVIVASRVRTAGIPLVARLDSDAVDPVTAGTLAEAFDRVVEGPSDGTDPSA